VKSLAWIEAENAELARAAEEKRAASLRRLKERVARVLRWDDTRRSKVNEAIDAWATAERKRNG